MDLHPVLCTGHGQEQHPAPQGFTAQEKRARPGAARCRPRLRRVLRGGWGSVRGVAGALLLCAEFASCLRRGERSRAGEAFVLRLPAFLKIYF